MWLTFYNCHHIESIMCINTIRFLYEFTLRITLVELFCLKRWFSFGKFRTKSAVSLSYHVHDWHWNFGPTNCFLAVYIAAKVLTFSFSRQLELWKDIIRVLVHSWSSRIPGYGFIIFLICNVCSYYSVVTHSHKKELESMQYVWMEYKSSYQ
jgi:hypothetical protein